MAHRTSVPLAVVKFFFIQESPALESILIRRVPTANRGKPIFKKRSTVRVESFHLSANSLFVKISTIICHEKSHPVVKCRVQLVRDVRPNVMVENSKGKKPAGTKPASLRLWIPAQDTTGENSRLAETWSCYPPVNPTMRLNGSKPPSQSARQRGQSTISLA